MNVKRGHSFPAEAPQKSARALRATRAASFGHCACRLLDILRRRVVSTRIHTRTRLAYTI
eukprot:2872574-Pleurochrysis_carterae.AAC.2